jgi:hypothetical protein
MKAIALTFVIGVACRVSAEPMGLPSASTSTVFCIDVVEQVDVAVPTSILLNVKSPAAASVSDLHLLTIRAMALADGRRLRVSVCPETSSFVPPVAGRTWHADDLSYVVGSGTTWSGASGRMQPERWVEVLTTTPNPCLPVTAPVVFRLSGITGEVPAGQHSLVLVWKIECP